VTSLLMTAKATDLIL